MVDFLFVLEGSKDIQQIQKLIYKHKPSNCKILSWKQEVEDEAINLGVPFQNLTAYVNPSTRSYSEQAEITSNLIKQMGSCFLDGSTFEELIKVNGLSLWEVASPLIASLQFEPVLSYIDFIRYVLEIESPKKIILAGSDCLFLRVFLAVAKEKNLDIAYLTKNQSSLKNIVRVFKPILQPVLRDLFIYIKILRRSKKKIIGREHQETKNRKILFLNTSPWQLRTFLPILEVLRKDSRNEVCLILTKKHLAIGTLEKEQISYQIADDYLDLNLLKKIKDTQKICKQAWRLINKYGQQLKTIQYYSIPVWKFIEPIVEHLLFNVFSPMGKNIELARHILEKQRPQVVVFTDDVDIFSRCMLLFAKQRNISLLIIQYGNIGSVGYGSYYLADKILVSGESVKDFLVRSGLFCDRIIVTGLPRFDILINDKRTTPEIKNKLGLETDKKVVLFTSTYFSRDLPLSSGIYGGLTEQEYYCWLRGVYSAFKDLKDIQAIAKPHTSSTGVDPGEVHKQVIQELNAADKIKVFSPSYEAADLIKVCDLIVTWDSTTATEAIFLGKDVVIVNLTGRPDRIAYVDMGVAVGAYKREDILPAIKMALEDKTTKDKMREARERFIKDYLYRIDGKASERIAELIKQTCFEYKRNTR